MKNLMHLAFAVAGLLSVAVAPLFAEDGKAAAPAAKAAMNKNKSAKPTKSLDEELLGELDNDLLEGIGVKTPPRAAAKPGETEAGQPAKPGAAQPEAAGEDVGEGPEDPLMRIGKNMRAAESSIGETKSQRTGELQKQIIADLAKLIEQLEQQQQSQSKSNAKQDSQQQIAERQQNKQAQPGSGKPGEDPSNSPARDSTDKLRKNDTQKPDMASMQGLMKDLWGQLPAHARDQMLQSPPEQFLPKYELLIEKYYKRLSEQKN